jgi:glucuronate isomerase
MRFSRLEQEVYEALNALPVIDVHTHLVGGHLGARGLHDILLYHMGVSDLYAAGCPTGARLTEYPGWPSDEEAERRVTEALPFLHFTANTSTAWAIRMILTDLYEWDEPVREDNWRTLDAHIRERAGDRAWHRDLLRRMNIKRVGTEWSRREDGQDDDIFQYSLEWVFFTRCTWGEYDTALSELERVWGRKPESATPIGKGPRPPAERPVRTLDDIREAVAQYVSAFPKEHLISTAQHMSTDLDLSPPSEADMKDALERRPSAGLRERSIYAAYVNELYLSELERSAPELVFQFSFGAEPLPYETGSRLSQQTIRQVGEMISRHPGLRFQAFLASRHANQSLCTLCRELPNFSLAGYWWHNFFPSAIRQVMDERLDMLPVNKQAGFFSDAYCVEWTYGKLMLVRQAMAEVLAHKIRTGQYSMEMAIDTARQILYESPQTLLGFKPSKEL